MFCYLDLRFSLHFNAFSLLVVHVCSRHVSPLKTYPTNYGAMASTPSSLLVTQLNWSDYTIILHECSRHVSPVKTYPTNYGAIASTPLSLSVTPVELIWIYNYIFPIIFLLSCFPRKMWMTTDCSRGWNLCKSILIIQETVLSLHLLMAGTLVMKSWFKHSTLFFVFSR